MLLYLVIIGKFSVCVEFYDLMISLWVCLLYVGIVLEYEEIV